MKLYSNATIKICEKNSFENDEGENIEFYGAYLKDDEGQVVKISSGKRDLSEFEGQQGVVVLNVRNDGGGIKLSLVDFRPEETIAF